MQLFRGQNFIEFSKRFKTDEDCKEYLAKIKWEKGYECVKCGYLFCQIRKDFSRTCIKCSHTETASANTLFHEVKFGIREAFFICFEMPTITKSLSASYVEVRFGVTEKTARLFMHKIRDAMKSSKKHPTKSVIHVDEFVIGGKGKGKIERSYDSKKKKVICAVELTETGKIKRMYALKINNFSLKELSGIFEKHIDKKARITTDLRKGHRPLCKDYTITQIEIGNEMNHKALRAMIHQVKSWIRTTYS